VSEIEVVCFLLKLGGSGLKNSIAVVSSCLLEGQHVGGVLDVIDGVSSLGLLIFNIGIQGSHLRSHVSGGLGPHSNVGVVAGDILSLGGGDGIAKVLKKSDNLLAS